MAKDLSVGLEDHPGTLADLSEALGKASINIGGICLTKGDRACQPIGSQQETHKVFLLWRGT